MNNGCTVVRCDGGCEGVGLGLRDGVGGTGGVAWTNLVAPVFADFAGKPWESLYPELMGGYYTAVRALGVTGNWSNGQTAGVGGDGGGSEGLHGDGSSDVAACSGGTGFVGCERGGRPGDGDKSFCVSEGAGGSFDRCAGVDGSVGSVGTDVGERGKHYWRNKRRRELAAAEKRARKVDSDPVVVQAGKVQSSSAGPGFFSGCDEGVRKDLQASRAKRLIAENLLAEAEAMRRHKYLASAVAFAQDFTRGMNAVKQLKVVSKDTSVCGWAATVSSSVAESLARSAPSTVPSLESVGFGASSLESSSGSKEGHGVVPRLEEYQTKEAEIRAYYDSLEMVSLDEVEAAVGQLKSEYADVLFSPKELARRELEEKVVSGIVQMDLSMEQRMKVVELVTL